MNNKSTSFPIWSVFILVVIGAGLRVVRHYGWLELPPNVAPVSALAMFGAATLPRRWSWAVPMSLMLVSDFVIGWYTWQVMVSVYTSFVGSLLLGVWIRQRMQPGRILVATLIGSGLFFLLTNAAVWAFQTMYPHTLAGLGQAYIAGLPFFRNTVLGDLGYSALFFGLGAAAMVYSHQRTQRHAYTSDV